MQTDASHSDVNCFGCQFLETSNQVVVLKTEAEDGPPVYDEPTCENKDGYQGVYSAGIHDANSFIDGSPYVTDWRSEIQIKQEECSFETTPQNRSDKERAREGERKGPQIHRNITRYMGVKEENHCAAKNYEPPSGMVDLRLFNDLKRDDKMTKEQRDEDRMRRMDSDWQGNELDFELISLDTESFDNFFNAKVENAFVDSLMRDAVNQTDNIGCTPSWHGESLVGPDAMESLYCNSTRKDNAIENGTENGVTECGVVDMEEPKITLGAEEVKLLKEALRTRSLEPVAYLLSRLTKKPNSTLSDGTLESCATYRTDTPRSPEDDMSSALSDYHGRLSSQDSWDSDRSSVLSDGQSGKRFSDGDLDDILRNNQLMRRGSEDQAIDSLRLTGIERGMKITEDARTKSHGDEMDGGNAVSDIVSAIDDMMKSSSDCDLDFFRDLLEKDGAEQIKQAATSKVWEEAGKNIMEVKEETIGRLEKNASRKSERLLMDHFSDGSLTTYLRFFISTININTNQDRSKATSLRHGA